MCIYCECAYTCVFLYEKDMEKQELALSNKAIQLSVKVNDVVFRTRSSTCMSTLCSNRQKRDALKRSTHTRTNEY